LLPVPIEKLDAVCEVLPGGGTFPCDLDEIAGESFAYVVEGVGGGQKKFMIL
jgi:hypothetical protein